VRSWFEAPPLDPDEPPSPWEEDERDRFAGLIEHAKVAGDVSAAADSSTFTTADLEELETRALELARVDPSLFIQYVFKWPLQPCHIEWQDLLSDHDRVVLWAPIEHGKSSQVSVSRPLFELGRNPNLRIALISNTEGQAAKALSVVKQQIELNPRLTRVFPKLKRESRYGRRALWHDTAIIVQREDLDNKDPSIAALGVNSSIIMGSRIDLGILDDINDLMNTRTPVSRRGTVEWFDGHVESRMTAVGRLWMIGTAWHREDSMEVLAKRPGWTSRRYDGWTTLLWPEYVNIGGKLCGWPRARLERKRETIPVLEFNRQFRNLPMSEDAEIFNAGAIESCFDGADWDPEPRPDWQTYVGVDLNVKRGETFDKTSFFIGRLEGGKKLVQRIVAKNMNLDEIIYWFLWIEARYSPVLFLVENNAAQDYIVQWFKPETITRTFEARGQDPTEYLAKLPRVKGFTTGANKMDPRLGIWGMTIEFAQRRWSIPDHELTRTWKSEMLSFDPHAHTGDILMSSWLFHSAVSKFRPRRIRSSSISSGEQ
jgi:hypothetical protein